MATVKVVYTNIGFLGREGETYLKEGTTESVTITHPLEGVTIEATDKVVSDVEKGMIYYTIITPD